jgi:hypothetical protein
MRGEWLVGEERGYHCIRPPETQRLEVVKRDEASSPMSWLPYDLPIDAVSHLLQLQRGAAAGRFLPNIHST